MLTGIIFAYAVICALALYTFIAICIGVTAATLKIFTIFGLVVVTVLWPVFLPALGVVYLLKRLLFKV